MKRCCPLWSYPYILIDIIKPVIHLVPLHILPQFLHTVEVRGVRRDVLHYNAGSGHMRNTITGGACCPISNSENISPTTIRKKAAEIFDPLEYTKRLLRRSRGDAEISQQICALEPVCQGQWLGASALPTGLSAPTKMPILTYGRAAHAKCARMT